MKKEKTIYVLVGNIASGKSTYLKQVDADDIGVIFSKDDLRKEFAKSVDEGYLYDTFLECQIHDIFRSYFLSYCNLGVQNIFIDETHMSLDSRQWVIKVGKAFNYKIKAIVFPDFGEDTHVKRRLSNNHGYVSEETWREVYNRKKNRYQEPTIEEGFDEIVIIGSEGEI